MAWITLRGAWIKVLVLSNAPSSLHGKRTSCSSENGTGRLVHQYPGWFAPHHSHTGDEICIGLLSGSDPSGSQGSLTLTLYCLTFVSLGCWFLPFWLCCGLLYAVSDSWSRLWQCLHSSIGSALVNMIGHREMSTTTKWGDAWLLLPASRTGCHNLTMVFL